MGGWGSSRWGAYRRKKTVEESLTLEAATFCQIPAGALLNANWGDDNHIKAKRTEEGLFVAYAASKTGEVVGEGFVLTFNNKSNRWYWICPDCSRRVTKLHKPYNKLRFRCRHCHNLTYRSVQERRKYQSLARRLAEGTGVSAEYMERFLQSDWWR